MKFKYIGSVPTKDLDLVIFGVFEPDIVIKKDMVFDVPDTQTDLIKRLQLNGNYEVFVEPKKLTKPKKQKKEEKDEEEEKEDK